MGTNYYLKRKVDFHPLYTKEVGNLPVQIKNGWLWENKYYPDVDTLNREYVETLHIGKSSYGWKFLLCAYPEYNINSLENWKVAWLDKKNYIMDEYNDKITPEELLDTIFRKHYIKRDLETIQKHSHMHIVDDTNKTYDLTIFTDFT